MIKDDGIGYLKPIKEGNGLTGIRERVKQFNGTVEIIPQRIGFCIKIVFKVG